MNERGEKACTHCDGERVLTSIGHGWQPIETTGPCDHCGGTGVEPCIGPRCDAAATTVDDGDHMCASCAAIRAAYEARECAGDAYYDALSDDRATVQS